MGLVAKSMEINELRQSMEGQLEQVKAEKDALNEELTETRDDLQQYESVMDNMKLSNQQLQTEVDELKQTILSFKQKDTQNTKDKQQNKEKLNKANEILSKYFTVSTISDQLNEKQLNETENKIETLSQNIISATKAYEA